MIALLITFAALALLRAAAKAQRNVPVYAERQRKEREKAELERHRKSREREAEKAEAKRKKEAAAKEQAALDIPFLKDQIGNLYALLDLAEMEYAATTNANKQARFLRQINGLNKQIHASETKLNKARAILDNNR